MKKGTATETGEKYTTSPIKRHSATGMDALIRFAANAPAEIPDWFKTDRDRPRVPDHRFIQDPALQADIQQALNNDGDPGTEPGREWMTRYETAKKAQAEYDLEAPQRRYFAWRWYYAEMMVKALYEPSQEATQ
jgi:hypothetical protein